MKNTRRLKFLSGVVVVLFWGFIMGGCQKEAIDSDMEGHWELLEFTTTADGKAVSYTHLTLPTTPYV